MLSRMERGKQLRPGRVGNMRLNRRALLQAAALTASPILNVGQLAAASGQSRGASHAWVDAARSQIPSADRPYFQTAGIAPSPKVVIEEVVDKLRFQNEGPVAPDIATPMSAIEPSLRGRLAGAFGATDDEVALTHSTSEGINIASWAIDWQPDDEVIITNQEHPANLIPWYNLRDRLGIKPMYFGKVNNLFLFGSELKALRAVNGWQPEINVDALAAYLRFNYIPGPQSIYKNISKLKTNSKKKTWKN